MRKTHTPEQVFAQLGDVWQKARGTRAMPARADINPAQAGAALHYAALLDVVPGTPVDFRYRLLGQHMIDAYGRNITGACTRRTSPPNRSVPSSRRSRGALQHVRRKKPQQRAFETTTERPAGRGSTRGRCLMTAPPSPACWPPASSCPKKAWPKTTPSRPAAARRSMPERPRLAPRPASPASTSAHCPSRR